MADERSKESLLLELQQLQAEHVELSTIIDTATQNSDEVTLQRLKKRKLFIKDKIAEIKSFIYPNIIA